MNRWCPECYDYVHLKGENRDDYKTECDTLQNLDPTTDIGSI